MSGDREVVQAVQALSDQPARPVHRSYRRFQFGDPIAAVLTKEELAAGLGYSIRQFDIFRAAGNHPAIRRLDAPGRPRFAGAAVVDWLRGGATAPARRGYFGTARRRA